MFEAAFYLFLILISSSVEVHSHQPKVKTPLGAIRGYYKISEHGKMYEAYEGVPYALPPVGKLRFKPPQPISAWHGELQATKTSHECLQYNYKPFLMKGERVQGSEDCLYLNIYVPSKENETSQQFPVIFWIYGGAFMHGSVDLYGPKFLMDYDVIYVSINYRVGPLGFLSTEDDVVPGNMGLKDQNMALRWVHDNIEYFGGDPTKVTLAGLSAGGASVHYHYFSPLSAGLFHNGISISGTALNCWTQTEASLEKAKRLANLMGCSTHSIKDMVKCLRFRPAKPIVQAVEQFMPWLYNPFTPFGPVIEKSGDKPFIKRSPMEMLISGDVLDVPWLTSITSHEGLYPTAEFVVNDELLGELDQNWETLAPLLLDFNYTIPRKSQAALAVKIRRHYVGHGSITRNNVEKVTKMVGDRLFVIDAERAAILQAKANKSPVWFYYYSYRSTRSLSDRFTGTRENFGVSHSDDSFLIFDDGSSNITGSENDRAMQEILLKTYGSFANNGALDAIQGWKNVDATSNLFSYMHIAGPDDFEMVTSENLGDKKFWDGVPFTENYMELDRLRDEL